MKYTAILFLTSIFVVTGCQSAPQTAPPPSNANQPPAPVSQAPDLAPKEVLKALNAAAKQKNVVEIKRHLSQGTLKMLDETAAEAGKTPDEILTQEGGAPFSVLPEMREEKIEGETATVEVQNMLDKTEYEKIPFVREGGFWKVAIDVYMDNIKKRIDDDMKSTEPKSAAPKK